MTMLAQDARAMIEGNRRSLAALKAIAARMADSPVNIAAHEAIVADQQDPARFGAVFYYPGARDAEMPEQLLQVRPVFRRQADAIRLKSRRQFADDCAKTIARLFPSPKPQEESQ